MGYTHHWDTRSFVSDADWDKIIRAVHIMLDIAINKLGIDIEIDTVNDETISFNGVGDDAHEQFAFDKHEIGYDFCKTEHKDYDVAVVAALAIIKAVLNDRVSVRSDGGASELAAGISLAKRALRESGIEVKGEWRVEE